MKVYRLGVLFNHIIFVLIFVTFLQISTAKNEINLFNNQVLIMAPVTFAPADATPPSMEFWFSLYL